VREAGDLSAGIFDLQGHMLAQAVTVRHFIEAFPLNVDWI
jgi:N-methylhydantoinase B/oxoprolinase/acetone carboxylase alpha subunit